MRIGEALGANTHDLGWERGHRTLAVFGKGVAKAKRVVLAAEVGTAIDEYLGSRACFLPVKAAQAGAGGVYPLFATSSGGRLDQPAVFRWLRRVAKQAGPELEHVADKISPHSLRHTSITAALDVGVDLRDVQDFARHSNPRSTRIYDRSRHSLDRHAAYAVSPFLLSPDRIGVVSD